MGGVHFTFLSLALPDGIGANPGVKEEAWIAIPLVFQQPPAFPDVHPQVIWNITSHMQRCFYTSFWC